MRVAFLGLGHMGLPMAQNLAAAGHEVVGFDVFPAAVEAARAAGLGVAESGADAVRRRPGSRGRRHHDVPERRAGDRRLPGRGRRGGTRSRSRRPARSSSTRRRSPSTRRAAAHALAEAAGHRSIDAPVSGGVVGAENATLAFMVGRVGGGLRDGPSLLEAMGRRVVHCGGAGLGQAAKVCNNMILAVSQIAVAEAFVLGERLGLDAPGAVRRGIQRLGSVLGAHHQLPGSRARCPRAPPTATTSRASRARSCRRTSASPSRRSI